MTFQPIQVTAHWEAAGWFSPRQFVWQGRVYSVESTGRQWEDEEGLHVLCMLSGGTVYELIFRLRPAGWWLLPPAGPARA